MDRRLLRVAFRGCLSLAVIASVLRVAAYAGGLSPPKPLTVNDAINTSRFQISADGKSVFVSPDGSRYVALVIRGDTANDRVVMDVIAGGLASVRLARPRRLARFVTTGMPKPAPYVFEDRGPGALIAPRFNTPRWLSNHEVALLWSDKEAHNQIFALDVDSGRLRQLTTEASDIVDFNVGANGSIIYDVASIPSLSESRVLMSRGFSVKSPDLQMLLSRVVDGTSSWDFTMCHRVVGVVAGVKIRTRKVAGSDITCELSKLSSWRASIISPDGRSVIISSRVITAPDAWTRYRGHFGNAFEAGRSNPGSTAGQAITQYHIVDIATGASKALWDVPQGLNPLSAVAWSPDSTAVLLAPTMLPVSEVDQGSLEGKAVAIVNVRTGRFQRIQLDASVSTRVVASAWPTKDRIKLTLDDGTPVDLGDRAGQWVRLDGEHAAPKALLAAQNMAVEIDQDMNRPPVLVARNLRTSAKNILFDPNLDLSKRYALGRVAMINWTDSAAHHWQGRLYYPAHYESGTRYPLVIQTHGYAGPGVFSLYGPGDAPALGPGYSAYLGQVLAGRDVFVLQVAGPMDAALELTADQEKVHSRALALADAARNLVNLGLVDPSKIGIMGHSATGRVIEDAITFTDFPYAAAIAADHYQANYAWSMMLGWDVPEGTPAPFGQGLKAWLDHSPALNAQRIRTPLQLELTTGGGESSTLGSGWEMFSRLRFLKKPVEYYVVPNIERGSHMLQNPKQVAALQDRALDWWLFWLKGEEDQDREKRDQYMEWHRLRDLHKADLASPPQPRLMWSVREE